MSKKVFIFVAALLLVTSVSMADNPLAGTVTQMQGFNIGDSMNNGMASVVALTHGDTCGSVIQSLNVSNMQSSPCIANPCFDLGFFNSCGVDAVESQVADLSQSATATGQCGILNVQTYLDAAGSQNQIIGFSTSPKGQQQTLGLAAQQVVTRADGAGSGVGTNSALLSQTQAGSNAGGSVFESSLIDACQLSNTGGAANSTTALASTLVATTTQAQQVQ
jgi:hypothetical protein